MEKRSPVSGNDLLPLRSIAAGLACLFVLGCGPHPGTAGDSEKPLHVREPAVAGQFYPGSEKELRALVGGLLEKALPPALDLPVRALVVPHAGYMFSGAVAAHAYKAIEGKDYDTVILMASSHFVPFSGITVYGSGVFRTPLGDVPVDEALAQKIIASSDRIADRPDAFARDHTIETQLPFLQTVLKDFKIVPVLFGGEDPALIEIMKNALLPNLTEKTLLVASTDLSHYPSGLDAAQADKVSVDAILTGDILKLREAVASLEKKNIPNAVTFMCGIHAVMTTMEVLHGRERGTIALLKYANSADVSWDKNRAVGYAAIAFTGSLPEKRPGTAAAAPGAVYTESEKKELLGIARNTVEKLIREGKAPEVASADPKLNEPRGVFVTIKKSGELRGCIGRFDAGGKPLCQIVRTMAIAAATEDPRFPAVRPDELRDLHYEISVLSPLEKIPHADGIVAGVHGVQIRQGWKGGVFLPQVATEQGWDRDTFLSMLCAHKAGLAPDCWKDPQTELSVFTAEVFSEE
ncbi:MAG: AmmeMemoRadiSam system protein B [Candidatus Omnitrophota bacterium]